MFLTRHDVCSLNRDDGRLGVSSEMAGTLETLPERVDLIERKLDALSASVDRRFEEVNEHFAEQRRYTEFAYERLDQRMTAGFDGLDQRMTTGFDRLVRLIRAETRRLERMEGRLDEFIRAQPTATRRRRTVQKPKKR